MTTHTRTALRDAARALDITVGSVRTYLHTGRLRSLSPADVATYAALRRRPGGPRVAVEPALARIHVEAVRCCTEGFAVTYRRPGVTIPLVAYVDGATAGGHICPGRAAWVRIADQRIVKVAP